MMLELDRFEVLRALPGGVVGVGPAPLRQGELATVGERTGVVTAVLRHEARVALVDGLAPTGAPVAPAGRVELPVGRALMGRVVDPLGRPLDGGPAPDCARAPVPAAPFPSPPSRRTRAVCTGVLALDALAPVGRGRSHLLLGASAMGRLELASSIAPPHGVRVMALPAASPAALRRVGSAPDTAVLASPESLPPYAHLLLLESALTLAAWLRDQGEEVTLLVVGLDAVARAARDLRRSVGWARDPWGWPVSLDPRIAALSDHALCADPGSLTLIATAGDEEPGLADHLVCWFDTVARLVQPPRPGHLPLVYPDSDHRLDLLPGDLRPGVEAMRREVLDLWGDRELAELTRDPELRQRVARGDALLARLSQRSGTSRHLDELR